MAITGRAAANLPATAITTLRSSAENVAEGVGAGRVAGTAAGAEGGVGGARETAAQFGMSILGSRHQGELKIASTALLPQTQPSPDALQPLCHQLGQLAFAYWNSNTEVVSVAQQQAAALSSSF